ncbi:unnamed protein product [Blepharisma stoltei]|uniref:non-specific serine/threonine protein kinase n=1 Tax=Blepharisma stoltei TaxID=1481888 RepID=A0AAU9ISC4_9CILI|nr:unnamed protein product [Blepharisma stoltei]
MDRYRKLRNLGRGRYGEVWLVEREDGALVAMKKVPLETEQPNCKEVNVLEQLDHPYIIQYHESFIDDGYLCIIMDYAEGGDLAARIRSVKDQNSSFNESQVWKWIGQLAEALNHIHNNKIIHRDLKSHNIFLTKDGGVQVGDFGISKILNFSDELAVTSVGTPYYLAPEICKGEPYDNKADIWSLGCIVYELCTLRRPFEGENLIAVVNSIINNEPNPIPDKYSQNLKNLVSSMLSKDKELRPSAAAIWTMPIFNSTEERKELSVNTRKTKKYQKEISINIPTPTHIPHKSNPVHPTSAPSSHKPETPMDSANVQTATHLQQGKKSPPSKNDGSATSRSSQKCFTFSESILKQCPNSPIRPMLMGDFLRSKLGDDIFVRVRRVLMNTKDPAKLISEEPWIISDICGEENLSIIDVGIAFDAFNLENQVPYPPTSTSKRTNSRTFAKLTRKASQ